MDARDLPCDPYNVIITGVGGQGNVMASRVLGGMLSRRGLHVTIGETFGASQRGGSVMSHLRVSARGTFSPQMPKGACHLVVALEPTEALRVLSDFGNPAVKVLCNTRPVHSIGVICGEQSYPAHADLRRMIAGLSAEAWLVDATAEALELGSPILSNIMMVAAVCAIGVLPVGRADFEAVIAQNLAADKLAVNLTAFDRGVELIRIQGKER